MRPSPNARGQRPASSPTAMRISRAASAGFLALLLFVVAGVAGLTMYGARHESTIYQGVWAAGIDLSGLTEQEAIEAIETRWSTYREQPITIQALEQRFAVTPIDAGFAIDAETTAAEAVAFGRDGSLWQRSRSWAAAMVHGHMVPIVMVVDPERTTGIVEQIASQVEREPVNASVGTDAAGVPQVVAEVAGIDVDPAASLDRLVYVTSMMAPGPMDLAMTVEQPKVSAGVVAASLPHIVAVTGNQLTVTVEGNSWVLEPAALRAMLTVGDDAGNVVADPEQLRAFLAEINATVGQPVTDAGVVVDNMGRLAATPSIVGREIDLDASVGVVQQAITGGAGTVDLPLVVAQPKISDEVAARAAAEADALLDEGIGLTWDGGEARLDRGALLRALTIKVNPEDTASPFNFGLDPDLVAQGLAEATAEWDRPVRDAEFRLVGGKVKLGREAQRGRMVNTEGAVEKILAAWGKPGQTVNLDVKSVDPVWTSADLKRVKLGDDVIAEGGTWYGGSSGPRMQNVEVAAGLVSGWLVPPGDTFSFAEHIGPVDASQGFVTGFGVTQRGEDFVTSPVIGGGICQVSTTLYQAAFWAGLPIVERYQHPYYFELYGESVTGMPGLDAMVNIDPIWTLDFKFKNTTGNWIAVVLVADGQSVWAKIIGTDPGWEVSVAEPVISNEKKGSDKMEYADSPELPVGQELVVETASDGFDVTLYRAVYKDGKLIDEYASSSSFTPARNLTLRGTGPAQ